jgi:hypothetical protein
MSDPIITKTLRDTIGLRPEGIEAGHEVLATYRNAGGEDVFALCRDGLLLRQGAQWRHIDNADIQSVKLPGPEVKMTVEGRRLLLLLKSGETLVVPVDRARGQFLDVHPIYDFVRRRVHQRRVLGG